MKQEDKKNLLLPLQQFMKRSTSLRDLAENINVDDLNKDDKDNLKGEKIEKDKRKQIITLSKMSGIGNLEESNGRSRSSTNIRPSILITKTARGPNIQEIMQDEDKKNLIIENANLKKDVYKLELELKKIQYENNKYKEEIQHQKNELDANESRMQKISMYCDKVNKLYYDMRDNYNLLLKKQSEIDKINNPNTNRKESSLNNLNIERLKRSESMGVKSEMDKKQKSPRGINKDALLDPKNRNSKSEEIGTVFLPELMNQKELQSYLTKMIQNKVFSIKLEDFFDRGVTIPAFVSNAVMILKTKDSLFRNNDVFTKENINEESLEELRRNVEQGNAIQRTEDCYVVAALLKIFFNELPKSLIFDIQDKLIEAFEITDLEYRTQATQSLVFSLPYNHRVLLQYMMSFFNRITSEETKNFMDIDYVCNTWGPIFIRIPNERVDEHWVQKTSNVIKKLMKEAQFIFPTKDEECKYKMEGGNMIVKTATIHKMLIKVIDNYCTDFTLVETFLVMHPYIISPVELLHKFVEFYVGFKSENDVTHWKYSKRVHILKIIQQWLEINPHYKEDEDFVENVHAFVYNNIKEGKKTVGILSTTTTLTIFSRTSIGLEENTDSDNSFSETVSHIKSPRVIENNIVIDEEYNFINFYEKWIKLPHLRPEKKDKEYWEKLKTKENPTFPLQSTSVNDFVQQMTYLENESLKNIPPQEFFRQAFMEPAKSPYFTYCTSLYNLWSQWAATEIMAQTDLQERTNALAKLIEIAWECKQAKNFNTSYSLYAGLNHGSITRLKQTWDKLPKNTIKIYKLLNDFWDVSMNHRTYRNELKVASPPLIPYLALFSKDVFGIEENNKTRIDDKMIHFFKLRLIFSNIKSLQRYQEYKWSNVKEDPDFCYYLTSMKVISEKESFQKSRLLEARQNK
eukprot:TRINITY_DN9411_c0_g1_i1.p1 TRINITY_DN9411_c0_g1~~TRINITY_DN9411_c0_g1_i1.p1  ORF type:complete len:913 (-),score=267.88 TRINITY_DN9411_c0_g1_i1:48-2786(-)